jgi:large subunit ribosomal protein L3
MNLEKKMDELNTTFEIRGIFHTQPWLVSGVPKKIPEIFEIKVSGGKDWKEQFEYAKKNLGKKLRIRDCLNVGQFIDTASVSKGKGFQGVVKRFGIKMLPRKNRKGKRRVGCIGPWKPARVMYTVPREGQMGFHQRVEYNKRIMKISEDPDEINPKGGFIKYGTVKNDYVLLLGSCPGAKKRFIRMRDPIHRAKAQPTTEPEITFISTLSQQGK